jgi:pyruvate dehydrogenase E1 component alpha subunit/2-oxoisovalerate dehydrogenase E1 component alpha subunit
MAMRLRGEKRAVLAYMGDGATSEGDFHVAMNFAGVFKAPVVLVCQNNGWAISVPVSAQTASRTIAMKARAYGFPGIRVDGNDLPAVVRATGDAMERARSGGGPTFLELVTYRRLGHSSSDDPTRYRAEAEVAEWERKDPVARYRAHLEKRRLWSGKREEAALAEFGERIAAAVKEAESAAEPPLDSLVEHVYAEVPRGQRDQIEAVRPSFAGGGRAEGAFPL